VIGPIDLVFAFFLDLAIGDPRWLPHPVRMIGRAAANIERLLRGRFTGDAEKAAGIILVVAVVVPAALAAMLIRETLLRADMSPLRIIGMALLVYLTATTIALRELITSARLVIESVKDGALDASRKKLAMIVGRDTGNLTEDGVVRATVETLAENLSDGVIAPIFYLTLGGIPLAIAYKAINTLDSMVGYKNERYIRFGWAAARLDDIANFIPARITGMFIVIAAFFYSLFREPANSVSVARNAISVMRRDGRNHTSPNSGIPEAAMAGALGLRLGGPSTYWGVVVEKPYIGDELGANSVAASESAVILVSLASFLSVVTAAILLRIRAML
jgi:adenosylcobinamide-phosphate synthase